MIKKLLILFIFLMAIITGYILYQKLTAERPTGSFQNIPQNVIPQGEQPLPVDPKQDSEALHIISEMNDHNAQIKNFSCDTANVYTWHQGLRLKLTGSLYFEKEMNLKMDVRSFVGQEFFMGSNNDEFWFWSRRLNPPALYHAKHADYYKTRLKSAFNPLMIMDSLGFRKIFVEPGIAVKQIEDNGSTKIALVKKTLNSIGQPIGHITFIDKDNKRLIGYLVTDVNGEMIASSEILEYRNDLPHQILYTWYEEDQAMLIELPNGRMNVSLTPNNWVKPRMNNEIDMGVTAVTLKWDFSDLTGNE